jgi:hypothetical protein
MAWLPDRLRTEGGEWVLEGYDLQSHELREPFFDLSVARLLRQQPRVRRSLPLAAVAELGSERAPEPAGFLFHLSRCGSTLVSRMLSASGRFLAFAEPAIVETVLRRKDLSGGTAARKELLQAVVQAFAGAGGNERAVVFKLTARATFDHELITTTFPSVPCVFLYREPIETLVSLVGVGGDRLPPGLETAGLLAASPRVVRRLRPAEFWARVLGAQCAAALELYHRSKPLLVNYSQLPAVVWTEIAGSFGIRFSAAELAPMQAVLGLHAKAPSRPFAPDGARKRAAATAEMRDLVDRWVQPHYERIEALRLAAESSAGSSARSALGQNEPMGQ